MIDKMITAMYSMLSISEGSGVTIGWQGLSSFAWEGILSGKWMDSNEEIFLHFR